MPFHPNLDFQPPAPSDDTTDASGGAMALTEEIERRELLLLANPFRGEAKKERGGLKSAPAGTGALATR